jgi:hypothetical protein
LPWRSPSLMRDSLGILMVRPKFAISTYKIILSYIIDDGAAT